MGWDFDEERLKLTGLWGEVVVGGGESIEGGQWLPWLLMGEKKGFALGGGYVRVGGGRMEKDGDGVGQFIIY